MSKQHWRQLSTWFTSRF